MRVDLEDVQIYKNVTKSIKSNTEKNSSSSNVNSLINETTTTENGFVICGQDIMLDNLSLRLEQYLQPTEHVTRSYISSYNGLYALYNPYKSPIS